MAFPRRRLLFRHQDLHTNSAVLGVALQITVSKKARRSQGREDRGLHDLAMLHWRQQPAVSMLSWLKDCHISHLSHRVSFFTLSTQAYRGVGLINNIGLARLSFGIATWSPKGVLLSCYSLLIHPNTDYSSAACPGICVLSCFDTHQQRSCGRGQIRTTSTMMLCILISLLTFYGLRSLPCLM